MCGNFLAAGGKRGVSFGVQRKIQRWQNQTMTSLVSIYLGIVLPTFFLVNSELPSKIIVKFLKASMFTITGLEEEEETKLITWSSKSTKLLISLRRENDSLFSKGKVRKKVA